MPFNSMKITFLRNGEIDRARWDGCIAASEGSKVYACSWYLDIVAPGWEALAAEDYSLVFPLTPGRKAGISYLYQPFFAQQLGLVSAIPAEPETAARCFRMAAERYRYIDIMVGTASLPAETPAHIFPAAEISRRTNHELNVAEAYPAVQEGYSQNTRRNIRKALKSGVNTGRDVRPSDLVKLFRDNFGRQEGKLKPLHYERMEMLMDHCRQGSLGCARGAYDENGLLSAAAFFLTDRGRSYFLFAASAPAARENGAMFLLIDQYLKENAGKIHVLDFEGGNDPNLGRFYKSFGAGESAYYRVLINRLPAAARAGISLARWIRHKI